VGLTQLQVQPQVRNREEPDGNGADAGTSRSIPPFQSLFRIFELTHSYILADERLDAGAHVDVAEDEGETALMVAVQNGRDAIIQLLLQAGANVNAIDKSCCTASTRAIALEHVASVATLLHGGADVNGDVHARSKDGFTALIWASRTKHDNDAVVHMLLDAGWDVKAATQSGTTS
jgi:ankyrin repeat protein